MFVGKALRSTEVTRYHPRQCSLADGQGPELGWDKLASWEGDLPSAVVSFSLSNGWIDYALLPRWNVLFCGLLMTVLVYGGEGGYLMGG